MLPEEPLLPPAPIILPKALKSTKVKKRSSDIKFVEGVIRANHVLANKKVSRLS